MNQDLFSNSITDIRDLLKEDITIYFFVNPVEFHGPHLSLNTDFLISDGLREKFKEKTDNKFGKTPYYFIDYRLGADPAPGAGSVNIPYKTLSSLLLKQCKKLIELGASKVVFMTFHGAPLHLWAIEDSINYLRDNNVKAINPFKGVVQMLEDISSPKFSKFRDFLGEDYKKTLSGDFHAGCLETSLALYLCEDSVNDVYKDLRPCPEIIPNKFFSVVSKVFNFFGAKQLSCDFDTIAFGLAWTQIRPAVGYTGRPNLATLEIGEFLCEEVILKLYFTSYLNCILGEQFEKEPSLKWLRSLPIHKKL